MDEVKIVNFLKYTVQFLHFHLIEPFKWIAYFTLKIQQMKIESSYQIFSFEL